jgi:hypothetical protein
VTPARGPSPGLPEALGEWIARFGGADAGGLDADALTEGALRALREALARTGRNREGAYALLAADALLTAAAQESANGDDPDGALSALLSRVAGEAPE